MTKTKARTALLAAGLLIPGGLVLWALYSAYKLSPLRRIYKPR